MGGHAAVTVCGPRDGVAMRSGAFSLVFGLTLCVAPLASASGQEAGDASQELREALRVFMDCRSHFCDFDHFRREINFINYVRDRRDAQVHVLVTTRRTGGGGTEFTTAFIGQREFEAVDDSLLYLSSDTDTFDEVRAGLTRMISLGLVRYVARLPTAEQLEVVYEAPDTLQPTPQVDTDPWNFWIFRIRVGGNISGEERQRFFAGNGALSANRTTEDWKIDLWADGRYSEDEFELDDGNTLTSVERNMSTGAFVARSLGARWSAATIAVVEVSTFLNQDLGTLIGPAIEHNFFPYSESTRRAFTAVYALLFRSFDYEEETIFDKTSEVRFQHTFEIKYSARQPWGSSDIGVEVWAFVDDPSLHSAELSGWLNVRLFRGLELNLNGALERVKDQIYLPKEGASKEEILLRRKALGTNYRYRLTLSLSYTFGSIFSNVVNPRFR
jgi:hypothetical protein